MATCKGRENARTGLALAACLLVSSVASPIVLAETGGITGGAPEAQLVNNALELCPQALPKVTPPVTMSVTTPLAPVESTAPSWTSQQPPAGDLTDEPEGAPATIHSTLPPIGVEVQKIDPEHVQLNIEISKTQLVQPTQRLEDLVTVALERDEHAQMLNKKAGTKYQAARKVARRLKSMAQFMTAYQGFESSSEAADVILQEKLKLKHQHAIEYVRQKKLDELHVKLFASMMQLAQGLGLENEQKRAKSIALGMTELEKLVGKEEAEKTLALMTAWSESAKHLPPTAFGRDHWDVMETQTKADDVLKTALKDDSVVKQIEARLHKFNKKSNFARASAKIVNTTLSIAMLSPTMISPAAQMAQLAFVALTGGPEEEKLLKEVYLDRCFESRFKRLSTESSLAINNYNMALLTKNPSLMLCSEAMMTSMVGREPVNTIVGHAYLPASAPTMKTEITLKPEKKKKLKPAKAAEGKDSQVSERKEAKVSEKKKSVSSKRKQLARKVAGDAEAVGDAH
jgi:hypothetical protein